jgi:oligoendopeptidase F
VQEKGTAIETTLLFFELEWAALDDARAEELLAADGLEQARHHLRTIRRYARTCSPSRRRR